MVLWLGETAIDMQCNYLETGRCREDKRMLTQAMCIWTVRESLG